MITFLNAWKGDTHCILHYNLDVPDGASNLSIAITNVQQ